MHQSHLERRERLRKLLLLLRGAAKRRVVQLRLADQRADHVGLPPLRRLRADERIQPLALFLRHDARADGGSPRRHFIHGRQIEVAVKHQRQRARNRGRAHHHHVRRVALALQRRPLANAEAMLLVGDRQPQIRKFHPFGNQRVRADDRLPRARGNRFLCAALFRRRHVPRQQAAGHAQRRKRLHRALQVLRGEDFRRRHQRGLSPGAHAQIHRAKRDQRLAAAHVALHHPRHRAIPAHIRRDLAGHTSLRVRRRKG